MSVTRASRPRPSGEIGQSAPRATLHRTASCPQSVAQGCPPRAHGHPGSSRGRKRTPLILCRPHGTTAGCPVQSWACCCQLPWSRSFFGDYCASHCLLANPFEDFLVQRTEAGVPWLLAMGRNAESLFGRCRTGACLGEKPPCHFSQCQANSVVVR